MEELLLLSYLTPKAVFKQNCRLIQKKYRKAMTARNRNAGSGWLYCRFFCQLYKTRYSNPGTQVPLGVGNTKV